MVLIGAKSTGRGDLGERWLVLSAPGRGTAPLLLLAPSVTRHAPWLVDVEHNNDQQDHDPPKVVDRVTWVLQHPEIGIRQRRFGRYGCHSAKGQGIFAQDEDRGERQQE